MTEPSVAVIGLGPMGAPIAGNLAAAFDTAVWNRTRSVAEGFASVARVPERVDDLDASVILSVLPDVDHLEALATPDVLAAWQASGTRYILIMSTTSPAKVRRFATTAAPYGIVVIDAPMSGGDKGAREATLSIMVGCTPDDFTAIQPVLQAIGAAIERMGDVGSGAAAKLCNQVIVASNMAAIGESLALARAYDLDLERLVRIFSGGLAGSAVLSLKRDKFLQRSYGLGGSAENQLKDLRYAQAAADDAGARSELLALVLELYEEAVRDGFGSDDHSVVQELFLRGAD